MHVASNFMSRLSGSFGKAVKGVGFWGMWDATVHWIPHLGSTSALQMKMQLVRYWPYALKSYCSFAKFLISDKDFLEHSSLNLILRILDCSFHKKKEKFPCWKGLNLCRGKHGLRVIAEPSDISGLWRNQAGQSISEGKRLFGKSVAEQNSGLQWVVGGEEGRKREKAEIIIKKR